MQATAQVNLEELSNAEANRFFWDGAGPFFERLLTLPNMVHMYKQVTAKVLSRAKFDPGTTVLMDFACGNGAFSAALAPYCKTVVGVDISQGMVDACNAHMQKLAIPNARALCTELRPDANLLAGGKFDVIICAQSYKHIDDNVAITRVLKSYLKPNGVLLVVDVIRGKDAMHVMADMNSVIQDEPPSRPKKLMAHMGGYTEDDMRTIFEKAGLSDFKFEEAFEKSEDGKSFGLFLARGVYSA